MAVGLDKFKTDIIPLWPGIQTTPGDIPIYTPTCLEPRKNSGTFLLPITITDPAMEDMGCVVSLRACPPRLDIHTPPHMYMRPGRRTLLSSVSRFRWRGKVSVRTNGPSRLKGGKYSVVKLN